MLLRIVRMEFQEDKVQNFLDLFQQIKSTIRTFEGCSHLELKRDLRKPNVFYTVSKWEDNKYLEMYRDSEFFEDTWSKTKILFAATPKAYSLVDID